MDKFRQLGISEPIIKAIEEHKFEEPSEIQAKAIPLVLAGKDVIASSSTGSGKTLAFGAGIIANTQPREGIQALVLTPTRELAEQITKALRHFAKFTDLRIASVYGGVSMIPQIREIRTAEIIIGTPGRVLDHLERRTLDTSKVKIFVLDEADRMLDMGFIRDVERIIKCLPDKHKRQTLLFSATIDKEISRLASHYLNSPHEVEAEEFVDPSKLSQVYYETPTHMKLSLLVHLLKNEKTGLVMVFCNTRRNTDFVARNLQNLGIDALAIHGGFSQEKRSRTMENFMKKQLYVLVCTDVAARGLDIKGVSHVYNYDIPFSSKEYVHRIGRTARAGEEGKAISILSERDFDSFRGITHNSEFEIKREEMPEVEMVPAMRVEHSRRGGFDRGRSGGRFERGGFSRGGGRSFGSREGRSFGRSERGSRFGGRGRSFNSSRGRYVGSMRL